MTTARSPKSSFAFFNPASAKISFPEFCEQVDKQTEKLAKFEIEFIDNALKTFKVLTTNKISDFLINFQNNFSDYGEYEINQKIDEFNLLRALFDSETKIFFDTIVENHKEEIFGSDAALKKKAAKKLQKMLDTITKSALSYTAEEIDEDKPSVVDSDGYRITFGAVIGIEEKINIYISSCVTKIKKETYKNSREEAKKNVSLLLAEYQKIVPQKKSEAENSLEMKGCTTV